MECEQIIAELRKLAVQPCTCTKRKKGGKESSICQSCEAAEDLNDICAWAQAYANKHHIDAAIDEG